jgi:hypothetical protein
MCNTGAVQSFSRSSLKALLAAVDHSNGTVEPHNFVRGNAIALNL